MKVCAVGLAKALLSRLGGPLVKPCKKKPTHFFETGGGVFAACPEHFLSLSAEARALCVGIDEARYDILDTAMARDFLSDEDWDALNEK
jgi:hypothetical protein